MIVGGIKGAVEDTAYSQENDALETILGMLGYEHPLQSCGPNALGSALEAAGWDLTVRTDTQYHIPADDLMTQWCNNPRNFDVIRRLGVDPTIQPNHRHAVVLAYAAVALFGARTRHLYPFDKAIMPTHLARGRTFVACIKPPGHYIAVVLYDQATQELIYNDSWRKRPRVPALPPNGFNVRMTQAEYASIVPEGIMVYPPGDLRED